MHTNLDSISTLGMAVVVAGLSVAAFSRTQTGDLTQGWRTGTYQRGYEERFEGSIPAHDGAVAIWAALKWAMFHEPASGAVAGDAGWLFTAEEFTEPSATRDLATELPRVAAALARDGITLVPVLVPDKARMQAHRLPRGRSDGFDRRYGRGLDAIAAANFTVIDLRPALDFDASFMRTDTHWSPEGARQAARAIAEALADVDLKHSRVDTVHTGISDFDGDLRAFVATGRFADHVGPAAEMIDTFQTTVASSGGLFGTTQIPVALVGTSFSAKSEFHFEGFLKQALQADVLNASRIGQGPFVPMDEFLADRASLSSLPTLVIWEIPERFLTHRRYLP